jgi:hypothetical protein
MKCRTFRSRNPELHRSALILGLTGAFTGWAPARPIFCPKSRRFSPKSLASEVGMLWYFRDPMSDESRHFPSLFTSGGASPQELQCLFYKSIPAFLE